MSVGGEKPKKEDEAWQDRGEKDEESPGVTRNVRRGEGKEGGNENERETRTK